MIDESDLRALIDRAARPLRWFLGLQEWEITWRFAKIGDEQDGANGRCDRSLYAYRKAQITLDPTGIDDEDDALGVLLHELLHLFTADIAHAAARFEDFVPEGPAREAYSHAILDGDERVVWYVEQLLRYSLDLPPRKLLELAERERGALLRPASGRRRKA